MPIRRTIFNSFFVFYFLFFLQVGKKSIHLQGIVPWITIIALVSDWNHGQYVTRLKGRVWLVRKCRELEGTKYLNNAWSQILGFMKRINCLVLFSLFLSYQIGEGVNCCSHEPCCLIFDFFTSFFRGRWKMWKKISNLLLTEGRLLLDFILPLESNSSVIKIPNLKI